MVRGIEKSIISEILTLWNIPISVNRIRKTATIIAPIKGVKIKIGNKT